MKRPYYMMTAAGAMTLFMGAAFAMSTLGEGTEATVLAPVKNVRGIRTPDRVITIDGFLYEDFESVADGEQRLPDGWKTTSTPGHDSDCWSAGTLGRGDTPLNGVSGFKYAYILGNKETAHDSWLFSPGVSLTAGKEYSIEFFAMMPPVSGSDVMEKLEVFIGDGQTPGAMTLKLEEIENDNDYWRWQGYTFTPETSGTYYMGFHSISPAGSNSTVIDDLKISSGDIPVFKGNTEFDMGSTDTRAGLLETNYTFSNDGKAALEVSFEECSDGLQVEGLPLVLDEYQDGTVKIILSKQEAGDYEGHVTLRTNDPTLPTVKIDVTATVKEARVTGYCFEDFEQGGPDGWDLSRGSANVSAIGGHDSSRAWYCTTFYQTIDENESLGGVGFTTHYVEMGDEPEFKFWYQLATTDMMGNIANDPTDKETMSINVYVSEDCGRTWHNVYAIEPGGEHEHEPTFEYTQVTVPLPEYAGKTCRVRLLFRQIQGSAFFNPVRILVDDVAIGTMSPVDLKASTVTGPTTLSAGAEYSFLAQIENKGQEAVSDYTVRIFNTADNSVITTVDGIAIESAGRASVPFSWTPGTAGAYHLAAEVISDADRTPDNNISYPLHTIVLPEKNTVTEIGTVADRLAGMYYPVNFYSVDCQSQSLYYANELGIDKGEINSMVFTSYLDGDFFSEPVSFYIAESKRQDFADEEFDDPDSFTKVFEGPIYFESGTKDLVIPFDKPYDYKGGNIVIMGKKTGKEFIYGKYFMIRKSEDKETLRSINISAFTSGGLENVDPTTAAVYPEIRFNMIRPEAGKVTGTVRDNSGAVAGALVKIAGTQFSTVTDATGRFEFPTVAIGDVAVEVSKHGYYALTSDSRQLDKGSEANFSIEMTALPRHTLSGTVISKTTGEPVEGVKITLKGYDDFQTYTDADGKYSIGDICGDTGNGYSILVRNDFFIPQGGDIEVEKDVTSDYTLADKMLRVHNVKALDLETEANVSWDEPMPEFAHDSGVPADYIGWAHGQSNVIVASVFHNRARIKEISWYTTDEYGWHDNFNVYVFGLDEEGNPDVKNVLYVARNVNFNDNAWTTHVIGNPVEADGFMIAVSCNGFLGIGITEPSEEHPFEEGQCYYAGDNYEWGVFPMSNFKKVHVMLRAYGENLGDSSKAPAFDAQSRITRPAANYNIYRLADGASAEEWEKAGSSTTLSFRDKGFGSLAKGTYRYAVAAVYDGEESTAILSNTIDKDDSGIEGVTADGILSLSPNPFTDRIIVSNPEAVEEIQIFSTAGALCAAYIRPGKSIDTTGLDSGMYIVCVLLTDGRAESFRMIRK